MRAKTKHPDALLNPSLYCLQTKNTTLANRDQPYNMNDSMVTPHPHPVELQITFTASDTPPVDTQASVHWRQERHEEERGIILPWFPSIRRGVSAVTRYVSESSTSFGVDGARKWARPWAFHPPFQYQKVTWLRVRRERRLVMQPFLHDPRQMMLKRLNA